MSLTNCMNACVDIIVYLIYFQVWARIWSVLAHHFIFAGSHPDEKVAMYAIDSLRQLAMKYLERAELANFTFQNDILKPFVVLIRGTRSDSIRRLIVDCIVQVCIPDIVSFHLFGFYMFDINIFERDNR